MISVLSVVSIVSIQLDTPVLRVQQSQPMGSTVPLMYVGGAFGDVRLRTTKKLSPGYPQLIHNSSTGYFACV